MSKIGEINANRFGTRMQVVQYNSSSDILVQFQDANKAVVHTTYQAFKKGNVKNPYDKSVLGVGCIGDGPYKSKIQGKRTHIYTVWVDMLRRCYDGKWRNFHKAYFNKCVVCQEWLNFQLFAEWYSENCYEVQGRLHLDKDILNPGNNIYSSDQCLLVPQRINMIFQTPSRVNDPDLPTGVYRVGKSGATKYACRYNTTELGVFETVDAAHKAYIEAKENHIRDVAKEYRSVIPTKVYDALMAYRCPMHNKT